MITCEYENSKENLIKNTYDYYIQKETYNKGLKQLRKILSIIVAWTAFNIIIRIIPLKDTQKNNMVFIFVIIAFIVGVYFLYNSKKYCLMNLKNKIQNFYDKNKLLYENKFSITINDDKTICIANSNGNSCIFKLDSLNNVANINDTFVLELEDNNLNFVPFTAFKNESEKDEFERIIKGYK